MSDPKRLREDDSTPGELRTLLGASSPPPGLPDRIYQGGLAESRRRVQRRRRQRIGGAMAAGVALAALSAVLWPRSPQIDPEAQSVAGHSLPAPLVTGASYLVPDSNGWLDRVSNPWGAQGAFYVAASLGSTVLAPAADEGKEGSGRIWRNEGQGKLCLKGSSAGIEAGDFATHWGVVAGVELCHANEVDGQSGQMYSILQCPWGKLSEVRGIRFDLEGDKIPAELRVIFSELDSYENAFVALYEAKSGRHEVLIEKSRVSYQKPPRPARRDHVKGVEWLIPSRLSEPAYFDFCVSKIELF